MSETHEHSFRTPMDPAVRAALDTNKAPVPMTEAQIAELYQIYEVVVTQPSGAVDEYIVQTGGGRMTGTQLGELFQRANQFPGAKEVRIRATNTRVPLKSIEDQIKRVKTVGLAPAVRTTPKAIVEAPQIIVDGQRRKLAMETPAAMVEEEDVERNAVGDPEEAPETGEEEFFEGEEGAEAEEGVETPEEAVDEEIVEEPPPARKVTPRKTPKR